MHYYHEAAEQGHAEARFSLALMLEVGAGLDRPYPEKAAVWYSRLAQQNAHAGAAHNLGILHAQGSGVPQDVSFARDLFELAVSLGGSDAMYSLGLLHLRGGGIPQNLVEAAMWAMLSVRNDPEGDGQKLLDTVGQHLTSEQLEEARARAGRWTREPKTVIWSERA
jgi:TPR repeat protein